MNRPASAREYAVLYLGAKGRDSSTSSGGNVILNAGQHALSGPEHTGSLPLERISTDETDATLVARPDGAGGIEFAAESRAEVPVDHGNMGSTETIDVSGGHDWHRGNLNVACAITVAGFTVDEGLVVVVELTGTGAITWDPDVTAAGDDQPDTSGYTVFVLFTSAGDSAIKLVKVGGSAGSALTVKDEGSSLDTAVTSIDAVGAGVTATNTGHAITLTIPGTPTGAAGGDLSGTYPNPSVVDDSHAHTSATLPATTATSGVDHEHVMDCLFSGDASTTAFPLPAVPFDQYSVAAYVSGVLTEVTLSGTLFDTATFGSAPAAATNNIRFDIVAAVI